MDRIVADEAQSSRAVPGRPPAVRLLYLGDRGDERTAVRPLERVGEHEPPVSLQRELGAASRVAEERGDDLDRRGIAPRFAGALVHLRYQRRHLVGRAPGELHRVAERAGQPQHARVHGREHHGHRLRRSQREAKPVDVKKLGVDLDAFAGEGGAERGHELPHERDRRRERPSVPGFHDGPRADAEAGEDPAGSDRAERRERHREGRERTSGRRHDPGAEADVGRHAGDGRQQPEYVGPADLAGEYGVATPVVRRPRQLHQLPDR